MSEWKPIESAPRGPAIDVHNGLHRYTDASWQVPDFEDQKDPCWCHYDFHTTYDQWFFSAIAPPPTHWMQIPLPPPEVER